MRALMKIQSGHVPGINTLLGGSPTGRITHILGKDADVNERVERARFEKSAQIRDQSSCDPPDCSL